MTPAGKRLLTAWQDLEGDIQLGAYIAAIEAEAAAAERARIAEVVRGLLVPDVKGEWAWNQAINHALYQMDLAAIEGSDHE